ncbi:MAG: YdeI family protein [Candidatus Kapaibacterium sp.]
MKKRKKIVGHTSTMRMNPEVDKFLSKLEKWQKEMEKLRAVVLDCGLTEEVKWGQPCYTFQNRNIVIIHGFKEYCALLFVQGALLGDPDGILIRQTENVQAGRQIRFSNVREIVEMEPILKAYIYEAIEVEKAGLKVVHKKTSDYPVPEEFQTKLDENPRLKTAFNALTPGRQRGYLFYFSQPKLSKTREARIEKYRQQILDGKGLMDDYIEKISSKR